MINAWHDLPPGPHPPDHLTAMVEIPRGSRNKYELDKVDRGEPDDKILAVPINDPYYGEYFDIADLPGHFLKEVEHFFSIYKDLEGRRAEIQRWEKSELAAEVILDSIRRYEKKYLEHGP